MGAARADEVSHPAHLPLDVRAAIPRLNFVPAEQKGILEPSNNVLPASTIGAAKATVSEEIVKPRINEKEKQIIGFGGRYLNPSIGIDATLAEGKQVRIPGFRNFGNTCFLAAVLQSLLHSPSFVSAILQDNHTKTHPRGHGQRFCVCCEVKRMVVCAYHTQPGRKGGSSRDSPQDRGALTLLNLARNINCVCRKFRKGRQEDAHEAVVGIFDRIMRAHILGCYQSSNSKPLTQLKDEYNTSVHRVFGGCLSSTILCSQCTKESKSYQPFIDLSVDIVNCNSVQHALNKFFGTDKLYGSNKYRCENCHKFTNALKKTAIRRLPLELFVQLKRFNGLRKNCRRVVVDEEVCVAKHLDVSEFRGDEKEVRKTLIPAAVYSLDSVIIHHGGQLSSGHYYAYVKEGDSWFRKDDDRTSKVTFETVRRDEVYLLFYRRASIPDGSLGGNEGLTKTEFGQSEWGKISGKVFNDTVRRPYKYLKRMKVRKGKQRSIGSRKNSSGASYYHKKIEGLSAQQQSMHKLQKRKRANDFVDRELDAGRKKKFRRRK